VENDIGRSTTARSRQKKKKGGPFGPRIPEILEL
jgi:hypothetical protein